MIIELTAQEGNALLALLDKVVRVDGLKSIGQVTVFVKKIHDASLVELKNAQKNVQRPDGEPGEAGSNEGPTEDGTDY